MIVVNTVAEAEARLSELLEQVLKGEEVIISRAGQPVAVLGAYAPGKYARKPGGLRGQVQIAADFDELPDQLAADFGVL